MKNASAAQRTDERPRLVVVEDDDELREGLSHFLRLEGYRVLALSNGVELASYLARWILSQVRPSRRSLPPLDAIITDVRMPGYSGLTIVEGLRAKGWTQPVVIMSAFGDRQLREKVDRLDDVVFVAKPFDPAVFSETLADLLQRDRPE